VLDEKVGPRGEEPKCQKLFHLHSSGVTQVPPLSAPPNFGVASIGRVVLADWAFRTQDTGNGSAELDSLIGSHANTTTICSAGGWIAAVIWVVFAHQSLGAWNAGKAAAELLLDRSNTNASTICTTCLGVAAVVGVVLTDQTIGALNIGNTSTELWSRWWSRGNADAGAVNQQATGST
jgi:hypothetical protein